MKLILAIVIIGAAILTCDYVNANEIVADELFSVEIPSGMIADANTGNNLSLVFAGDSELKKGLLSVTARRGEPAPLEIQWQKVRSLLVNNKTILFEKEVVTPALTWKALGVEGKSDQSDLQDVEYYSVIDGVIYMLHYHCWVDRCGEIETAFRKVLATFKPVRDNAQFNRSR